MLDRWETFKRGFNWTTQYPTCCSVDKRCNKILNILHWIKYTRLSARHCQDNVKKRSVINFHSEISPVWLLAKSINHIDLYRCLIEIHRGENKHTRGILIAFLLYFWSVKLNIYIYEVYSLDLHFQFYVHSKINIYVYLNINYIDYYTQIFISFITFWDTCFLSHLYFLYL